MKQLEVINILKKDFNFDDRSIQKLKKFADLVLSENKNHNLIAKSTESSIWDRHILDSAQLVKFIDFKSLSLADLGSGAGFPGLVIEIFNKNKDFHVKLYEKSSVKRQFLIKVIKELNLNATVFGDLTYDRLETFGAVASHTRGVFGAGNDGSDNFVTTIDYVQIMSTGNGVDFGDLQEARGGAAGCSNGNGGLG